MKFFKLLIGFLFPIIVYAQSDATITTDIANKVTGKPYSAVNMSYLFTDLNGGKLNKSLTSGHLFVGNGSNVATDVAASGDITVSNSGVFKIANQSSNSGKFLTTDGTSTSWTTVAGGITNSAANTELMMSNGTNAVHSGLFSSASIGDLTMGTSLSGATRTISADGSSANVALNLYSKGNSPIQLGASLGAQIYGFAISNNTSTPITTLKINHRTINTPAVGIGVFMDFETHTGGSTYLVGTSIGSVSTSITPGSESFDFVFKNMSSGATAVEDLRIKSSGTIVSKKDFLSDNSSNGMILKSPNGHYWRITVDNTGALTTTDIGTSIP